MSVPTVVELSDWASELIAGVERRFFGNRRAVELCVAAALCRGHLLIEDLPGTGKTLLARSIAEELGGRIKQVQCTPDLMPSDILGVSVYNPRTEGFVFKEGPIMTNFLLVDEINRATPRTQSALLEAMAEGQVSVEGRTVRLPEPFVLVATQSPAESEGTFPLPEVQKDRFFLTLTLGYPSPATERRILSGEAERSGPLPQERTDKPGRLLAMQEAVLSVHVAPSLARYIMAIVGRSRIDPRLVMGISPRGSLALYKGAQALAAIRGRDYVVPEDVKEIAPGALASRILLKPEHTGHGLSAAAYLEELFATTEVPGYEA